MRIISLSLLLSVLLITGCRSLPEIDPDTLYILCDFRCKEILEPHLPIFGIEIDFQRAEDLPELLLDQPYDGLLTLDGNRLDSLDWLLRPLINSPPSNHWITYPAAVDPALRGQTLLRLEVFRPGGEKPGLRWVMDELGNLLVAGGMKAHPWNEKILMDPQALAAVMISEVNFRRVPVEQSLREIWRMAEEEGRDLELPELHFDLGEGLAPITLSLRNVSVLDAMKTIIEISGLFFRAEGDVLWIERSGSTGPNTVFIRIRENELDAFLDRMEKEFPSQADVQDLNERLREILPAFLGRKHYENFYGTITYNSQTGMLVIGNVNRLLHEEMFGVMLRMIHFPEESEKDLHWVR